MLKRFPHRPCKTPQLADFHLQPQDNQLPFSVTLTFPTKSHTPEKATSALAIFISDWHRDLLFSEINVTVGVHWWNRWCSSYVDWWAHGRALAKRVIQSNELFPTSSPQGSPFLVGKNDSVIVLGVATDSTGLVLLQCQQM